MTETLAIRMSTAHDRVEWLVIDESGAPRSPLSSGELAAAASLAAERPVLVVVDDAAVTRTSCNLPVSGRKLAQALPYALEEQFACDVETLHFAAGDAGADGERPVAALELDAIAGIVDRLGAAGIGAQRVYAWHDAISPLEGFVQLLIVDDQVLLCDEAGSVAALRGLPPDVVLEAWRAAQPDDDDDGAANNLRVFHDAPARERFAASIDALTESGADVKQLADGLLPFAARHIAARGGVNLLQGQFAVRSDVGARLRPWALAASLAGVALALSIVVNAVELRRLEKASARLDGDIVRVLQSVQPGSASTGDPERLLGTILERAGGGDSDGAATAVGAGAPFLPTLDTLAGALQAAGEDTRVDAISYRGGVFDIRLTTPSAQTLEGLTQRVADGGNLTAQIQRTEQEQDAIKSFVQIRGAGQ